MSNSVAAALDESQRVVKKQKTCAAKVDGCIDELLGLAIAARDQAASSDASAAAVRELSARAESAGLIKEMNTQTKDLHSIVAKLSKV